MKHKTEITAPALTIHAAEMRNIAEVLRHATVKHPKIAALGTACVTAKKGAEAIRITCTDLDMEVVASVPATAGKAFDACLPHRLLLALADKDCEMIGLTCDGDMLDLRADDMTGRVRLLCPPEDFPTFGQPDTFEGAATVTLSETSLHRLLHLCRHCISMEETRYYLNGMFLTAHPDAGTIRAVATDGHRMAVVDDDTRWPEGWPSVIIPMKAVDAMLAMSSATGNAPITITVTERYLRVMRDDLTLTTKLIDGTYPKYSGVIPAGPLENEAVMTRAGINRLLRMNAAMGGFGSPGLTIYPDRGQMVIRSFNESEVTAPVQARGDSHIGFNARYLSAQARVTPSFRIRYANAGDPAIIEGGNTLEHPDRNAFWVFMPMRTA